MNKTSTFSVKPSEALTRVNARLSQFHSSEYEKGSLEVHTHRNSHHITVRTKEPGLPHNTVPGSRESWTNDYFPDVIRLVFDRPIRRVDFPTDSFQINSTPIPSDRVTVDDQWTFSVSLTGVGGLGTGNNTLSTTSTIYGERGGELKGQLWNGELADDVLPRRGSDVFYSQLGGKIRVDRLPLHKNTTIEVELNRLSRRRRINVLDYVHINTSELASISGWLYVLYDDAEVFEIDYIDPSSDAVFHGVDTDIIVKFSTSVDPQYTASFNTRVTTTNYESATQEVPASISWSAATDLLTITPAVVTQTEGLHQLQIDMDGVTSLDGQAFVAPGQKIWSTYYIKDVLIPNNLNDLLDVDGVPSDGQVLVYDTSSGTWGPGPGGTGGGGGGNGTGAPKGGPYVTWQADGDLTDERTVDTGVYIDITNDGTNVIIELDTGQTDLLYADLSSFNTFVGNTNASLTSLTGHTGNSSIHFQQSDIDHTNLSEIGNYEHSEIDAHIDSITNPHLVTASQVGSPTIAAYTSHTGHTGFHFTVDTISHDQIADIGSNDHDAIDAHISNISNPHAVDLEMAYQRNATIGLDPSDGRININGHASLSHLINFADDAGGSIMRVSNNGAVRINTLSGTGNASFDGDVTFNGDTIGIAADEIDIADSSSLYSSSEVEGALQELGSRVHLSLIFRRNGSLSKGQAVRGLGTTTDNSSRFTIPAGATLKCVYASIYAQGGATSGPYDFSAGLAEYQSSGSSNTVATYWTGVSIATTEDIKTHGSSGANVGAPLFETTPIDGVQKTFQLFMRNDSTSTGTSTSDNYMTVLGLILEQ